MQHHTRLWIDLRAYEENIRAFLSMLSPSCRLCAVVKSDAYGHGLSALAPIAVNAGAAYLGITENEEACVLRDLNLACPLLRLRPATREEAEAAWPDAVEEIVGSYESARMLSEIGVRRGRPIPVHLKLDVGIGRMGFSFSSHRQDIDKTLALDGIRLVGIMTHFPVADEENLTETRRQLGRFEGEAAELQSRLTAPLLVHAANSSATLRLPESHKDLVRIGIASYGLPPSPAVDLPESLQPVLSWITAVVQVREVPAGAAIGYGMTYRTSRAQRIATLPVGYADGYVRALSNRAHVLIRGRRCPIVGRVSMNMTTVDVTGLDGVVLGEEAVLIGRQGNQHIPLHELSDLAGTITYELACLIGACNRDRRVVK